MKMLNLRFPVESALKIAAPHFDYAEYCRTSPMLFIRRKSLHSKAKGLVIHDRAITGRLR